MTNGFNVGIVNLVGQAISKNKFTNRKNQITAIGICKWGGVKNADTLGKSDEDKKKVSFILRKVLIYMEIID